MRPSRASSPHPAERLAVADVVVSVTAHAMAEHVAASLASGADRHMAKPLRADVLIATVIELTMPGAVEQGRAA